MKHMHINRLVRFIQLASIAGAVTLRADTDRPPDEIGPNSRAWIISGTNSAVPRVVEMTSGMNYWDGQKWTPSQPAFEVAADGFAATRLQYLASISFNLNTVSAVTIITRDGITIRSTPVAIGLYDTASGASTIIGAITNCSGMMVNSNKVIFENAFQGISVDLVYTIERGSFEQDAVIRQRLDPADYGFPRDTTRIQIFSELYDAPAPEKIRRPLYVEEDEAVRKAKASPDVIDEVLGWGEFVLATGRAFDSQMDSSSTNAVVPVPKELRTISGRTFIIESVDYSQIKVQLQSLPEPVKKEASLKKSINNTKRNVGYAAIPKATGKRQQAGLLTPKADVLVAKRKGVTIDYIANVSSTLSGTIYFRGDATFFISGPVVCNGPVSIEGGAVFKFKHYSTSPVGDSYIKLNNTLTCKSTSYRPAIFTAVDDDSVGNTLNGWPGSGYQQPIRTDGYANPALWVFNYNSPQLSNLRFSYCQESVRVDASSSGANATIAHAQFVNCIRGIVITGCGCGCATPIVNNSLFATVSNPITISRWSSYPNFYNCTVANTSGALASGGAAGVCNFYNSILASVYAVTSGTPTVYGDYNGFYSCTAFGDHQALHGQGSPFQATGAGNYYLTSGSGFRNAGTRSVISNSLIADLANKTVDPPIIFSSSSYPSGLALFPHATLDSGTYPSLGFHYDRLDFLVSQLSFGGNGSVALLTNGVAVGVYGTHGFAITEQGSVISEGGPLSMNRLVFYPSVQEQPYVAGDTISTRSSGIFKVQGASSTTPNVLKPVIRLRFTDLPMLGLWQSFFYGNTCPSNLNAVCIKDCWLRGVNLTVGGAVEGFSQNTIPIAAFTNNLIERSTISLFNGLINGAGSGDNPLSFAFYNNLFWQSYLTLTFNANGTAPAYNPVWNIQDNLFDTTNTLSLAGNSAASVTRSYNAFYSTPNAAQLACTVPNTDKPLTGLTYTTGPDGSPWYVASVVPLNSLEQVDTSRSAATAGLFHYAVRLDQAKAGLPAGASGSIGWHHVALTSQNVAPNKYATQSSTANGGVASRAIDGNTAGSFSAGSVSSTASELQPWWQLDLGQSASIATINLFSRTDCCQLNNFYVFVSDDPFQSTSWSSTRTQPGVSTFYFPGTVTSSTAITIGRTGRYVRVQLPVTTSLSLAEVQIQTAYAPSDTERDGLPDYLENTAGDGIVHAGETDWTGPIVAITSPSDGFSIGTTRINIHGTVTHTSPIKSVTVNGILAFLNGTDFDALNVPLGVGANRIVAVAEDMNGNAGSSSINISGVPSGANLIDPVTLTGTPVAGFDALNVSFQAQVDQNFPGTIQEVRVDFVGANNTLSGNLGAFTHVYNAGQFFPVVTVRTLVGTTSISFSSLGGWNPTTPDRLRINVQPPPISQNVITISDPVDLEVGGPSGHLYVLSRSGTAVSEYDSSETFVRSIALPSGSVPTGLDVDGAGNVYVALSARNQVAKYKLTGSSYGLDLSFNGTGLIGKSDQTSGSGNGEFNAPYDVAVTPDGTAIAVSDSGNNRIQQFTTANGAFVLTFGSAGTAVGQFNTPKGLTYDNVGYLYIVDSGNNRLALALSSSVIGTSGSSGTALGQFQGAVNLCVGPRGIYVGETGNNRVQFFDPRRGHDSAPTPFTTRLSLSTELGLSQPNAIAPIPDFLAEKIYIADTGHGRVLKVTLPETAVPDDTWNPMKSSLLAGNVDQAVSYFSQASADDYRAWFIAIGNPTLSSIMNKTLTPAVIEAETGQYYFEDVIVIGGETITFPVEFVKENGIWKILEF